MFLFDFFSQVEQFRLRSRYENDVVAFGSKLKSVFLADAIASTSD